MTWKVGYVRGVKNAEIRSLVRQPYVRSSLNHANYHSIFPLLAPF
jgi:hypothetical protein